MGPSASCALASAELTRSAQALEQPPHAVAPNNRYAGEDERQLEVLRERGQEGRARSRWKPQLKVTPRRASPKVVTLTESPGLLSSPVASALGESCAEQLDSRSRVRSVFARRETRLVICATYSFLGNGGSVMWPLRRVRNRFFGTADAR
jgi:hypothetical protein